MKITLRYIGPANDDGARFDYEATVDVDTTTEAEFAGREFGTLTHHAALGVIEAQKVALQVEAE